MVRPRLKDKLDLLEKQVSSLANDLGKLCLDVTQLRRDVRWLIRLVVLILLGMLTTLWQVIVHG